jgi:hypothetical protein
MASEVLRLCRRATHTLLDTETFSHKRLYTQKLSPTEAFIQRSFYTKKPLYTEALTQSGFCTNRLLHRNLSQTNSCYTSRSSFYTQSLYTQTLFPKKLLHRDAFTQRSLATDKPCHILDVRHPRQYTFRHTFGRPSRTIFAEGCSATSKTARHHTFRRPTTAISAKGHVSMDMAWLPLPP